VLRNTDGNNYKGVNEWSLYKVLDTVKQGAIRPNTGDIFTQLTNTINHRFVFRKKVATNMEHLRAKVSRIVSYGISYDETAQALTI
jgi:hypothetical protein